MKLLLVLVSCTVWCSAAHERLARSDEVYDFLTDDLGTRRRQVSVYQGVRLIWLLRLLLSLSFLAFES